ncbi:MAG: hypothetical protein OEN01_03760 [Candidatus Krumholzibacteria bacterium]|nr:hypothetical protein [Candidatus Krumholzibacteria bacterium]
MTKLRHFRLALPLSIILTLAYATCGTPLFAQDGRGETRQVMWEVFHSLTAAYTYALDPEAYENFSNREDLRSALLALSEAASELEEHGGGLDPSFAYIQASLASDARRALQRLDKYQFAGSRFLVTRLTQNCMICHVRVESHGSFDLGKNFLEETGAASLEPLERVSVEIAVRQFETALRSYEEIFGAKDSYPLVLNLGSTFEDYLRLCIGTRNETQHPIRAFQKYIQREDMPSGLKELMEGWIESLENLDLQKASGDELAMARGLIRDAELKQRFVSDRSRLVDFIAAEMCLHRYLQKKPTNEAEIAEAYYLLAVAEANASRSYWISETPFLLERAIREAPGSPFAKKAFTFLEEYTIAAHAGSTVPGYVDAHLTELRNLLEN